MAFQWKTKALRDALGAPGTAWGAEKHKGSVNLRTNFLAYHIFMFCTKYFDIELDISPLRKKYVLLNNRAGIKTALQEATPILSETKNLIQIQSCRYADGSQTMTKK